MTLSKRRPSCNPTAGPSATLPQLQPLWIAVTFSRVSLNVYLLRFTAKPMSHSQTQTRLSSWQYRCQPETSSSCWNTKSSDSSSTPTTRRTLRQGEHWHRWLPPPRLTKTNSQHLNANKTMFNYSYNKNTTQQQQTFYNIKNAFFTGIHCLYTARKVCNLYKL